MDFHRRWSVNRRTELRACAIDGELSAMVIEMIHEDERRNAMRGIDIRVFRFLSDSTWRRAERRPFRQRFLRTYETLRKRIQNFLSILGLRCEKPGASKVSARCRSDASGTEAMCRASV